MIVVLAGGVGAARFLQGLVQVVPQQRLTVIVNTGDDRDFYGLHVSPDLDIVMYTLAGIVDEKNGWGIRDDTYHTMQQLTRYGNEDWFLLGDGDLATHIHRTNLLRQGKTLSEVIEGLRKNLGLELRILPMSDQSIATHIQTPVGLLHFQEYMVKRHCTDEVQDVVFVGASAARPAPGVLDAIKDAEAILIAPSNPIVSIGSILAVPGIHDALHETEGYGRCSKPHRWWSADQGTSRQTDARVRHGCLGSGRGTLLPGFPGCDGDRSAGCAACEQDRGSGYSHGDNEYDYAR